MTQPHPPHFAAGCDFSTKAVHLAVVGDRKLVTYDAISIEKLAPAARLALIRSSLHGMRKYGENMTLVIEEPFLKENANTLLTLAWIAGQVDALAIEEGFYTRRMKPSEWRAIAGVDAFAFGKDKRLFRDEWKAAAIAHVKAEYRFETKDNNLAESILIAGAALAWSRREALTP